MKVAVYGTLRKGESNHALLSKAKYVGLFETNPEYNFFSVNDAFPAITQKGNTSIIMEVYEVSHDILQGVDNLEGYDKGNKENNLYNRIEINTPFGKAYTYVYNKNVKHLPVINGNDWKEYISIRRVVRSIN